MKHLLITTIAAVLLMEHSCEEHGRQSNAFVFMGRNR